MIIIGYSGHSYVAIGILRSMGISIKAYCDAELKQKNPFMLDYIGHELSEEGIKALEKEDFFISIGNNLIRRNIFNALATRQLFPINIIHADTIIDATVQMANNGIMVSPNTTINALSVIGNGAICNTGCIIEHECLIGNFAHIGPGTVLCGNVHIGENSFIGASSVIRENIKIGKNVIVGAGSVVVKDIPDNTKVVGNPARPLL
ncbi:MAG: acetyltransferase [Bacteroidetes bacterium]|nr:acetyltransferase [Bacteroidota bacterium]